MRPLRSASLGAIASSLVLASPALAGWTAPQSVPAGPYDRVAGAVNEHGVAAFARGTAGSPAESPQQHTIVYAAQRMSNGHMKSIRLWASSRTGLTGEPAVVIDRTGEVTVAWIAGGSIRATYGRVGGRFAPVQIVGPAVDEVHLAVARDGEVLLTWIGPRTKHGRETVWSQRAAFRTRGHRFGAVQTLTRPAPLVGEGGPERGAVPLYDARGTGWLSAECDGMIRMAPAHTRRFGRPLTMAGGPTEGLSLSVIGHGNGLATWASARCNGDAAAGPAPGPVGARILTGAAWKGPVGFAGTAISTLAVASPDGGGEASWSAFNTGVFGATVTSGGVVTLPRLIADGLVAVAVTSGGDQVRALRWPSPTAMVPKLVLRPAGGGPDQVAPLSSGTIATSGPSGRAVIALAGYGTRQLFSVWTP